MNQEGIPPRSKVRSVIMDRTLRPLDREVAQAMFMELGFGKIVFLSAETQSWGRTQDNCSGFTHTPENAQDHYWRLLCIDKVWYFQFVDYSPRAKSQTAVIPSQDITAQEYLEQHGEPYIRDDPTMDC